MWFSSQARANAVLWSCPLAPMDAGSNKADGLLSAPLTTLILKPPLKQNDPLLLPLPPELDPAVGDGGPGGYGRRSGNAP